MFWEKRRKLSQQSLADGRIGRTIILFARKKRHFEGMGKNRHFPALEKGTDRADVVEMSMGEYNGLGRIIFAKKVFRRSKYRGGPTWNTAVNQDPATARRLFAVEVKVNHHGAEPVELGCNFSG